MRIRNVSCVAVGCWLMLSGAPAHAQTSTMREGAEPTYVLLEYRDGPAPELDEALSEATPLQTEVGKNRKRGALWGGAIGFVAGGVLGGLSVESDSGSDFGSGLAESAVTGEAVLLGAVFGAAVGALLGATLFAPSASPGEGHSVQMIPTADGIRYGLQVSIHWGL